ncbi:ribonuclease z, mitochondrial, partial [Plakobranchus ocellatus]
MPRKNKNKQAASSIKPQNGNVSGVPKKGKSMKAESRPPSTINIVVIGTGGPGTSHSLLVTTEFSRYMFNCGEGTQRLAAMGKGLRSSALAKLSGLQNIFITHKSWENTGGLLGLSMRLEGQLNPESRIFLSKEAQPQKPLSEKSPPSITIHGPPGVEKIALMAKKFSESAGLNIVKASGEFSDSALTIQAVPFYKNSENQNKTGASGPVLKKMRRDSSPQPETSVAYAYICQPKSPLGKINVEKCLDAGITIGPMVGRLQRGESVTLDDGTIVHPDQVTDFSDSEKRPFLVVECPSLEFLPSLIASESLGSRLKSSGDDSFSLVVHMTPEEVYNSTQYQLWMR